jgi:hypothetical protein
MLSSREPGGDDARKVGRQHVDSVDETAQNEGTGSHRRSDDLRRTFFVNDEEFSVEIKGRRAIIRSEKSARVDEETFEKRVSSALFQKGGGIADLYQAGVSLERIRALTKHTSDGTLIGGLGALAYDYDTFNVYVVNEGRVTKSSRKERALAYRMAERNKAEGQKGFERPTTDDAGAQLQLYVPKLPSLLNVSLILTLAIRHGDKQAEDVREAQSCLTAKDTKRC